MLNSDIALKAVDSGTTHSPFAIDVLVEPLHVCPECCQTLSYVGIEGLGILRID